MVVDDDEVNNFILNELLKEENIADTVLIKSSVDSAIGHLRECEDQHLPQVILLDINMPIKDGFDFLEEYYENGLDKNPTSIILLTSSLFEKDKAVVGKYEKVLDFVIKPLDMSYFKKVLAKIPVA